MVRICLAMEPQFPRQKESSDLWAHIQWSPVVWECDGFCVIGGGALLPSQLIPQVCKPETEMIMIVNSVF